MARFLRTVSLALKSLMLHKLRSGLTMLGIVFGVFSVIAMLAIGEGASNQAQQQVLELGATNIIVRSVKPSEDAPTAGGGTTFVLRYGLTRDDFRVLSRTLASRINGIVPMREVMLDASADPGTRREAVKGLAGIRQGAVELQKLAEAGELDGGYKEAVIAGLQTSRWQDLREYAAAKYPLPPTKDSQPLPPISELATRSGDVANGRIIFNTTGTCNKCHQVNGIGLEIGPNLSEIGKKLTKEALLESILYPSAAISHNYETWSVLTEDGQQYTGLLVSDTAEGITLKDDKGILRTVAAGNVEAKKKQDISLMPADVQQLLTQQELLDLVEYMTTLKERRQ